MLTRTAAKPRNAGVIPSNLLTVSLNPNVRQHQLATKPRGHERHASKKSGSALREPRVKPMDPRPLMYSRARSNDEASHAGPVALD